MDTIPPLHDPVPPGWSLLLGEVGRGAVYASVAFFLVSLVAWFMAAKRPHLQKVGIWGFGLGCASIGVTFATLATLFVANRFEFSYVYGHADKSNSPAYQIAGIWSGQEGSFLLWSLSAAIFGLLVSRQAGIYRRWFTIVYALFLGLICSILAYESPFNLNMANGAPFCPPDGVGLAPSLQNYWVIIHPPTIFLGFGSLTALFALAAAALATRNYEDWLPIVRPWSIISVTLVGLGLCMGGFWAYETLGWGGFWMWDPVENVSFVPWCLTAALVHGIIVQTTRKRWRMSNLLMAGLPFITFTYGTFLTRSGFLADASVHSFAEMNRSALQLLTGVLVLTAGGFLALWITRLVQDRKTVPQPDEPPGVHREAFYRAGVLLLGGMGVAALVGMSVPFMMALAGRPAKVVEERLYHLVLPWIFIPLMLVMGVAPFASWRGMPAKELGRRFYSLLCLTVGITGLMLVAIAATPFNRVVDMNQPVNLVGMSVKGLPWVMFLVGLCVFVLVANIWRMAELVRRTKLGVSPFLTHFGVGVLMAGLIVSRGFERHEQSFVMKDHPGRVMNYQVTFAGMTSDLYDRDNKAKFDFSDPHKKGPDAKLFTATPGLYYARGANGEENPMVWPHIQRFATHDVYFTIHPPETQAGEAIALKPGESAPFGGLTIKFDRLAMEGQPGMSGTKFGAVLKVTSPEGTQTVVPKLQIGGEGPPTQLPAKIDDSLNIALLGMDAGTSSVRLQVQLASPMYPIEVYHKPMTALVWIGTGLMTLGGFLAAYYRRRLRVVPATVEVKEAPSDPKHHPRMPVPARIVK